MEGKGRGIFFDDYSLEEVPSTERYGLYNMFLTLSASFGAIAVLFAGGVLGGGLNFVDATIAVLTGGTTVLAIIGALSQAYQHTLVGGSPLAGLVVRFLGSH
jgi:purine-cytosine permease-like protein